MARVTAELRQGMRVTLTTRDFRWPADEPPEAGGTDSGPTPYELLLGALAACIALTLRVYTSFKQIPLDGVDVELAFDRIHADDCRDCDSSASGRIEQIASQVTVYGAFDDTQRRRLTEIVGRCPVHKTLAHGVHFSDAVTFGPPDSA